MTNIFIVVAYFIIKMINQRCMSNTSDFEYQCFNCGWRWDVDKYRAGALLLEIRDIENSPIVPAWSCDFCLLRHIEKTKLSQIVQ